jgi:hypothetical protein
MAYTIEDENGFVGLGPSINGLRELKAFVSKQNAKKFPVIGEFLEHGFTPQTKLLANECRMLADASKEESKNLAFSFNALAKDATKAKGIVILAM